MARLIAEEPSSYLVHLMLITAAVVLLWKVVPPGQLVAWAASVILATAARFGAVRASASRGGAPATTVRTVRLAVAAVSLAWGVGAAAVMPAVLMRHVALLLVVISGLVAGASSTLVADLVSFRLFALCILGPLPFGILANGTDREHWVAVFLVAAFAGFTTLLNRRSHTGLVEYLRALALLSRQEREARRERAHVDSLLASAPIAIAVVTPEGVVQRVNHAFETLFGYTSGEVVERPLRDVVMSDMQRVANASFEAQARLGEPVSAEVERTRKDGGSVPVRLSVAHVPEADGSMLVLYEDITERKRTEGALAQAHALVQGVLDAATLVAVIAMDEAGTIRLFNRGAELMLGYQAHEVVGKATPAMLHLDEELAARGSELAAELGYAVAGFDVFVERARLGGHEERQWTYVRKDGGRLTVLLAVTALRDPDGRLTGFLGVARDVTKGNLAEAALREARDAAERLAQTRSAFLANMSHEIRTPLNAVLGLAELLLDSGLTAEQRRSLSLIQSAGETLLTLLNDILDFSKIEAEHLQLEDMPFELPHLVETTIGLLGVRARQRDLELLADVEPNVPVTVRGDPTRLRQVLTNLVGNAIKFTATGEVVVHVTSADTPDGHALVRFAVRDTGIGIPPEQLGAIFEEFSQADASTTRKFGGTGLGLAIARRIVTLMGGHLSVTSEVGRGSEFAFTLPMIAPAEQPPPAVLATPAELRGRRVLLADDNPTNRRVVQAQVAHCGMHVAEAEDGTAALHALRRAAKTHQPFDLAILDGQMPGLDGFEVAAAVRADPALAGMRLLLLTSSGQRGDGQRCREVGINAYLTKPVARGDLVETIAAVFGASAVAAEGSVITQHSITESRRCLRVLLAEDNPVNQEVAATMLRRRGHEVDVAANGREAVEAARRGHYDVILMDIQMPELDGFGATHEIRALAGGAALPIIALTAHALAGERERCLAEGMSGYLSKPFRPHDLFAVVEGWAPPGDGGLATTVPAAGSGPPVDLEGFRRMMREAGAEDAVPAVLDTFVASAGPCLVALEAAVAAGDARQIERAAHAFKSAAASIGARGLAGRLQEMEDAGDRGAPDGARTLFALAQAEAEAVLAYLQTPAAAAGSHG